MEAAVDVPQSDAHPLLESVEFVRQATPIRFELSPLLIGTTEHAVSTRSMSCADPWTVECSCSAATSNQPSAGVRTLTITLRADQPLMDEKWLAELRPVELVLNAAKDLPSKPFEAKGATDAENYAKLDEEFQPVYACSLMLFVDIALCLRFRSYATCSFFPQQFGQQGRIVTRALPHARTIRFRHRKVFLLGRCDVTALAAYIQSEKLTVELHDRDPRSVCIHHLLLLLTRLR